MTKLTAIMIYALPLCISSDVGPSSVELGHTPSCLTLTSRGAYGCIEFPRHPVILI